MKRILLIVQFIVYSGILFSQSNNYVTLEGKQFKDENGNPFYPIVCNYLVEFVYLGVPHGYHISPEHGYGSSNNFECTDETTCDQAIINDFMQIKSMGFNSIRITGLGAYFNNDSLKFFVARNEQNFNQYFNNPMPNHFVLNVPYNSIHNTSRFYEKINHVLELAYTCSLKVILLTGGSRVNFHPLFEDLYTDYLAAYANYINNYCSSNAKKALLAYDYFNEPLWSKQVKWPSETYLHTKNDICERTSKWYNALKQNDPNHLITMGGSGFEDIFEYDPSSIKLDFYSPHFYPLYKNFENPNTNYTDMMNRFQGHLYWLYNNSAYPWIIGETGFLAQQGETQPMVDGTLQQQFDFAQSTLQQTLNCDASGYSWWNFQNFYWAPATTTISNGNFFGLLDYGLCNAPCSTGTGPEKLVVNAFRSFNPNSPIGSCLKPINYYDPHNHLTLAPNNNKIDGTVIDQFGNPIEDALIIGSTIFPQNSPDKKYYSSYTFTNETGNFSISTFDPFYGTNTPIFQIQISCIGCNRVYRESFNNNYSPVQNNQIYTVEQHKFTYDNSLTNITISGNNAFNLQGYNSLTLKDITVLTY